MAIDKTTKGEWAYNSRSTRPVVHWWPESVADYRKALCGSWAHDACLDVNFGKMPRCARCAAKIEKSS